MNREIIYGTSIIIFVVIAVLIMNLLSNLSSNISVSGTVSILTYIGAVVVGWMSLKSSKMDAPQKYTLLFGIFGVLLFLCGILMTVSLI
ncbi:hypothetical protein AKJ56_00665 [candidate division MSBL1 archaeon SCGC-AAA382N08]|uniref:Uncharacterized protein n=1 Tax=candidate division MSBL1 archaeon SCGC-AAA382N08 TaxID=1698285 RepID=A0A133VQC6_9EURY|nr:hypothetical protein AKJ56_00665 [candidate division MSBL1 archaeon SCGC-AAA382N08]